MAMLHVVHLRIDAATTAVLIVGQSLAAFGSLRAFRQAN